MTNLRILTAVVLLMLCSATTALAQYHPLEITSPKAGLPQGHRVLHAYPGVEYNVQAAVVGGTLPYVYALSNAPSGMTISALGIVSWPSPTGNATPQLVVTDARGQTITSSWSITVGTAGWGFVDAAAGNDANAGTQAAPWRTLARVSRAPAGSRTYFAAGTYTPDGLVVENDNDANGEERVVWHATRQSTTWIALPGATPVVDFGYTGSGAPYNTGASVPRFRMVGDLTYVDGLTFLRSMTMAFQMERAAVGVTVRRCRFTGTGPGIDGGNSGHIMWRSNSVDSYGDLVIDNVFEDVRGASTALKYYSVTRALTARNTFRNGSPSGGDAMLALKGVNDRHFVRENIFENIPVIAIGGNQHWLSGEIAYNLVKPIGGVGYHAALRLNQDGLNRSVFVYRNTFMGRVLVENVSASVGPFLLRDNVIINTNSGETPWPFIVDVSVSDPGRVTVADNLTGQPSDGVVDATGRLTGSARTQYLGVRGHEQTGSTPPPPPPPACEAAATPSLSFLATGGSAPVPVGPSTCAGTWTTTSGASWLTPSSTSASGPGQVTFTAGAHSGTDARSSTVTVAGTTIPVSQAGTPPPPPCTYSVVPTSYTVPATATTGTITVTASSTTCTWTAVAPDAWITLSDASGIGSDAVTYAVAANPGPARTATVTVAGHGVTIAQEAPTTPPTTLRVCTEATITDGAATGARLVPCAEP